MRLKNKVVNLPFFKTKNGLKRIKGKAQLSGPYQNPIIAHRSHGENRTDSITGFPLITRAYGGRE